MRAPVQRNDAHVVNHLGNNREMIVSLNDLIVIVVERGQHGRSAGNPSDTPLDRSHVLRAIVEMMAMVLFIGFKFPLGFRCERRHSSILGVRNDRITFVCHEESRVTVRKGRIVTPYFIWPLDRLAITGLPTCYRSLFEGPWLRRRLKTLGRQTPSVVQKASAYYSSRIPRYPGAHQAGGVQSTLPTLQRMQVSLPG